MIKQTWNSFLFRERSVARVIRDSFAVIKKNNKTMFLQLWSALLLVAVINVFTLYLSSVYPLISNPWIIILMVISFLAYFFWRGALFTFFRNYRNHSGVLVPSSKINYKEWVIQGGRNLLILLPLLIIIGALTFFGVKIFNCDTLFSMTVLLFFIFILVIVPFVLIEYQYMIGDASYLKSWKLGSYHSYKYWGTTFLVIFISGLIYSAIFIVAFMPVGILQVAVVDAAQHIMMGDEVNLPSWIPIVFVSLSFISIFFIILIDIIKMFPLLFQYASIEKHDVMKQK